MKNFNLTIKKSSTKFIDSIIYFIFSILIIIALSGGFSFEILNLKIKAHNTKNLFIVLTGLLILRILINKGNIFEIPFIQFLSNFSRKVSSLIYQNKLKREFLLILMILFALLLRLHNITAPLIGKHSWRQADTAAIARNYYHNGYKFLYPQIDWRGDTPGYVESEFPIYEFIVALVYKITGVSESIGRFISIICSLISLYILYLLVKEISGIKHALWTSLFFTILSPSLYYSRTFQPESSLIMCIIIGIYLFYTGLKYNKFIHLLFSAVFISLACLIKIPTLYIGLPLFYIAWKKFKKKVFSQLTLWIYTAIIFIPLILWYYHAHQLYLKTGLTFGIWGYGTDKWGNWDLILTTEFWLKILFERGFEYLTIFGLPIFFMGIFMSKRNPDERIFDFFLIAFIIYIIIVGKGNYVHDYYQLPLILIAPFYMGKVFDRYFNPEVTDIKSVLLLFCAFSIIILGIGRFNGLLKRENIENSIEYQLAQKISLLSTPEDKIILINNGDPTVLYLSNRTGWIISPIGIRQAIYEGIINKVRLIAGIYDDKIDSSTMEFLIQLKKSSEVVLDDGQAFILLPPKSGF